MPGDRLRIVVVGPTRDRPDQIAEWVDVLARQDDEEFTMLVVDQSARPDPALATRAAALPRLRVVQDGGRGLSRARNVALRETDADWLVFCDDDCRLAPGWVRGLREELAAHPEADLVAGHVAGVGGSPETDVVPQATFPIDHERIVTARGHRWPDAPWPYEIGFGVCFAVRRTTAERVGGWDEALGPGSPVLPAADDMDFNHRLLRAGAIALVTPRLRAEHVLWRDPDALVRLMRGYHASWMGFAAKTLKQGDRRAGVRLLWHGVREVGQWATIGVRTRSPLMARIVVAKVVGGVQGLVLGLRRDWRDAPGQL